jgi:hypothetical protein
MNGKIWGILLSMLGIAGLIAALIYINGPEVSGHLAILLAAGVCGALAFFAGIWLIDHKGSVGSASKERKPGLMPVADAKIRPR